MTTATNMDVQVSEACADLFAALSAFQGEVKAARKTASNPHFKSKFADLAEVIETAREPMAKHGLALVQMPVGSCDGTVRVVTLVTHKSGQWLKGVLDMPLPQKTPQGVGSTISYARRYCAMAALGIAADDDDGEQAEGRGKPQGQQAAQQQQRRSDAGNSVLATLTKELAAMGGFGQLVEFRKHAIRVLGEARVPVDARKPLWAQFGERCKALSLDPVDVVAAADGRAA